MTRFVQKLSNSYQPSLSAIEIDGGKRMAMGSHNDGSDFDKDQALRLSGWQVIRIPGALAASEQVLIDVGTQIVQRGRIAS